jgi:sugar O-acyltransferase (sialic acid O-acetyltransferase NeuD family)
MSRKLILVGDSLFAEIAHEYFEHDSDYDVVAFSVEREYLRRDAFRGLPVVPFEDVQDHYDPAAHDVYCALTYAQVNRLRARMAAAAKAKGYGLASYVSSRAFVWRNVELGEHCFVFEDNTVQPFVTVGSNVVMWSGNHVGHHSTIEDNVFVASHAVISGSVTIGRNSFVGVNATIVNDVEIGPDNWLGPDVTITRSTGPNEFWRPARSDRKDQPTLELFGVEGAVAVA